MFSLLAENLFFFCISHKSIGPFVFLPVRLCDVKCHWEYPNMSALVGFNCLASLGFERRIWMKAVLLCRFVCYTHVPFPYNRFLVYVWALGRADLNEQLFVIERDWDNWSIESNKVYCHWKELGVSRNQKADTEAMRSWNVSCCWGEMAPDVQSDWTSVMFVRASLLHFIMGQSSNINSLLIITQSVFNWTGGCRRARPLITRICISQF